MRRQNSCVAITKTRCSGACVKHRKRFRRLTQTPLQSQPRLRFFVRIFFPIRLEKSGSWLGVHVDNSKADPRFRSVTPKSLREQAGEAGKARMTKDHFDLALAKMDLGTLLSTSWRESCELPQYEDKYQSSWFGSDSDSDWVLCAIAKSASGRAAAGWRLPQLYYGGRAESPVQPHYRRCEHSG